MMCIHSASENGHYHLVESLLTDGVDVNSRDEEDETPLNLAARRGFMNIVGLLIAKGADQKLKNKYGVSAAIWAMTESHVDVVIFLLRIAVEKKDNLLDVVNACDKDGDTLLMVAASGGHSQVVNHILDINTGALEQQNLDGDTALLVACREGHIDVVRLLLLFGPSREHCNKRGESALSVAARENNVNIVRLLIVDGFNINFCDKMGDTPLIVAVKNGNIETVQVLMKHRASPTQLNRMNNTPLMIACQLGHEDIAIDIAAHMDDICDFNFRNRAGFSALHYAYQSRSYKVADFLISRGALVDITDLGGETLLHKATRDNNVRVMEYLIRNGSDITLKNKEGETPLMTATTSATITFLLTHGSDRNDVNNEGLSLATLSWISGRVDLVEALIE